MKWNESLNNNITTTSQILSQMYKINYLNAKHWPESIWQVSLTISINYVAI